MTPDRTTSGAGGASWARRLALGAGLVLLGSAAAAAQDVDMRPYLQGQPGDEWRYTDRAVDRPGPLVIRIGADGEASAGLSVRRGDIDGGVRWQALDPAQGLLLHRVGFPDGRVAAYARPVLLLPSHLRLGTPHRVTVEYVVSRGAGEVGRGVEEHEVEAEAIEDLDTPAGVFPETIRVRMRSLGRDEDGSAAGCELVEWLAREVGPVRVTGRFFWLDAKGQRTRLERMDAVLESATVGSRRWPAAAAGMPPETDPDRRAARARALDAFRRFGDGLATGRWQPFLDRLDEAFTFFFPTGRFQGLHRGRSRAAEFFEYVTSVYPDGLFVSLDRLTLDGDRAVFEFRSEGTLVLAGERRPYRNRVAVAMQFRGDRIADYREYFGSDGRSY